MNTKRLTKKQMWIFAIGQLGWSLLGGIINAWLVAFYLPTESEGVNALIPSGLIIGGFLTVLGLITACCRIWDAVSDPLVANMSDRSKNKRGRRIPFMQFSAIPFALITVLVFVTPVDHLSGLNIAWVAVFLVLFYTAMTVYCTPYNALISEFGKTQDDRMYISTAISLTYFAGTLLAYTPFVFAGFLKGAVGYYNSYRICFIVLAVVAAVCMLLPTFLLKEKEFVDAEPSKSNAFKSLTATFKNKEFRVFTASDIMYWIGLTLFQTGLPFFVKVSFKLDESLVMVLMGAMTVLSAVFYPFVTKFVNKFGKKKLIIAGFFGLAVAYGVAAVGGLVCHDNEIGNTLGLVFGALVCVVSAFPMALLGIIPNSVIADIAEADGIETGERREGMFYAARTFAMKFGQSIAMLSFTSLAIIGTTADIRDPSANDITAHWKGLLIVAVAAIVFCVIGGIILMFYKEKKIMKTIAKDEVKAVEAKEE